MDAFVVCQCDGVGVARPDRDCQAGRRRVRSEADPTSAGVQAGPPSPCCSSPTTERPPSLLYKNLKRRDRRQLCLAWRNVELLPRSVLVALAASRLPPDRPTQAHRPNLLLPLHVSGAASARQLRLLLQITREGGGEAGSDDEEVEKTVRPPPRSVLC
jgi:hypothetical protein